MSEIDWSKYKNFTASEFNCQETDKNRMQPAFLERLQELRNQYGKQMVVTSGYRSPDHSIERRKDKPGTHAQGIAADIYVKAQDRYRFVKLAINLGFTGIGIDKRFIHLDISKTRSAIWTY